MRVHPEPDWRAIVAARVEHLDLPAPLESDVVAELAQMLEDASEEQRVDVHDEEALGTWIDDALSELPDLGEELRRSREARVGTERLAPERVPGRSRSGLLSGVVGDVVYALRTLRKSPGFTLVAVLTLALGIGLNASVFSIVSHVILKPFAAHDTERLSRIYSQSENGFTSHEPVSYLDLDEIRRNTRGLADAGAFAMAFVALEREGRSTLQIAEIVTGSLFPLLGTQAAQGRLIGPEDDLRTDVRHVAVIGYGVWMRDFGGRDVLGERLRVNGVPFEVVGVAPKGFDGLFRGIEKSVWISVSSALAIGATPSTSAGNGDFRADLRDQRSIRWLWPIARLEDGASHAEIGAQLDALHQGLLDTYPDDYADRDFTAIPFRDVKLLPGIDQNLSLGSIVLLSVVGLVLLIACANLANLLLVRALARRKELATRLSLGASRGQVARQLLIESSLLAFAGASVGLGLAAASNRILSSVQLPLTIPLGVEISLDYRVILFTVAAAFATSILFGLAPALEAWRTDLASVLRTAGVGGGPRKRARFQGALVVVQVTLSLVLLVFAGLVLRGVRAASQIDPGFDPAGRAAAVLMPDLQGYTRERAEGFYRQLREELSAEPGVSSVSLPSHIPLTLWVNTDGIVKSEEQGLDGKDWPQIDVASVDHTYFETMAIPLKEGRSFSSDDASAERNVVVINEALAQRYWPQESAIGQRLVSQSRDAVTYEVVGVVGNGRYRSLGESQRSFLYYPIRDNAIARTVLVAFDSPSRMQPATIERVIRRLDPNLAVDQVATVETLIGPSLLAARSGAALFSAFGILGLLLAAIGLYGVLAFTVGQKRHEIGIRVAMGAHRASILGLVLRDGLRLVGLGALLGIVVAIVTSRALSALLYGISPTDAATFGGVVALLIVVSVLASLQPAIRATRFDPLRALRHDD